MRRLWISGLAVVFWVLVLDGTAVAQATGSVVGKECLATWVAPTTNTDGTPMTGALAATQANVYVTTTATPPTQGTPTAVLAAANSVIPSSWGCAGVTPGQHWIWVSYSNVNGEGALTSAPFVLSTAIPNGPTGLGIR